LNSGIHSLLRQINSRGNAGISYLKLSAQWNETERKQFWNCFVVRTVLYNLAQLSGSRRV